MEAMKRQGVIRKTTKADRRRFAAEWRARTGFEFTNREAIDGTEEEFEMAVHDNLTWLRHLYEEATIWVPARLRTLRGVSS